MRARHASVLARLAETRAWALFRDALAADLDDTQGGTTAEGVHLGAMAGTVDIAGTSAVPGPGDTLEVTLVGSGFRSSPTADP